MIFTITTTNIGPRVGGGQIVMIQWVLRGGSEERPGDPLAVSPRSWDSEEACRADIAHFRKKAGGMRFAKVVNA